MTTTAAEEELIQALLAPLQPVGAPAAASNPPAAAAKPPSKSLQRSRAVLDLAIGGPGSWQTSLARTDVDFCEMQPSGWQASVSVVLSLHRVTNEDEGSMPLQRAPAPPLLFCNRRVHPFRSCVCAFVTVQICTMRRAVDAWRRRPMPRWPSAKPPTKLCRARCTVSRSVCRQAPNAACMRFKLIVPTAARALPSAGFAHSLGNEALGAIERQICQQYPHAAKKPQQYRNRR